MNLSPPCGFLGKQAITRRAPLGLQQAPPLVVTHGFQINSCFSGQAADCKRLHLYTYLQA